MKLIYLEDKVVAFKNLRPIYGFKIKGGKYGDLKKVMEEEEEREGNPSGRSFNRTQFDYNGKYE